MPDDVTEWLAARAVPLASLDPGAGPAGLRPLKAVFQGVRLVGLGEATHGSAEFFLLRWRLTEFLIKELGFTTLAIEASAAAARAVDAYTAGGPGDPREALAGLGFWTLNTAEMLTVLQRLREHNRTADRPVRFVGIDPQHPMMALAELRACLGKAAAPLLDPLGDLGASGFLRQLDRQVEADARRLEEYVNEHGPPEAREPARIVRQFADVASRPYAHADPARTLGVARDRYMAENVALLMADPGAKVAVWAHNAHITKRARAAPVMGTHLARTFGAAYYALGLLFGHGEFRAHRRRFGRLVRGGPVRFRVPRPTRAATWRPACPRPIPATTWWTCAAATAPSRCPPGSPPPASCAPSAPSPGA
nr:erythromycin esterase family protein [Nonomuraea sp. ATCC 55076]